MDLRELQKLKADEPIVVTVFGITIDSKEVQPEYLLLVDYQCYTL